jgi:hypothetical protein
MKPSGWLYTDANNFVSCPKCKSTLGVVCRTTKNKRCKTPHKERLLELSNHKDFEYILSLATHNK